MAGTITATGFGLQDVSLATRPTSPGTSPTWIDVPAVTSAAFQLEVEEVDQFGDDKYLNSFYHSAKGTITIRGTKASMRVFELLSGNSVTQSGSKDLIYFGTQAELIPPRVIVRATVPVTYEDGSTGTQVVYWFNCNCKTVWENLPGNERAAIQEVNLMLKTFSSSQDENGDALSPDAHGRMEM